MSLSEPAHPCEWVGCLNEATERIKDVSVTPKHSSSRVFVGHVKVCAGHRLIAQRLGHLNLDWQRILKAMEG